MIDATDAVTADGSDSRTHGARVSPERPIVLVGETRVGARAGRRADYDKWEETESCRRTPIEEAIEREGGLASRSREGRDQTRVNPLGVAADRRVCRGMGGAPDDERIEQRG